MKNTLAISALLTVIAMFSSAQAQNTTEEIRQLKIKVETLEHALFRDGKNTPAHVNTLSPNHLNSRISVIEESLRAITKKLENLEYTPTKPLSTAQKAPKPKSKKATPLANDQYQKALSFVYSKEYKKAERKLSQFITDHSTHSLIENAQYWLGETYYARELFKKASVTFLNAYENFPNHSKTNDNLLKLGLSLAQINKTTEACITYNKLLNHTDDISISIKSRAREEHSKLNCS